MDKLKKIYKRYKIKHTFSLILKDWKAFSRGGYRYSKIQEGEEITRFITKSSYIIKSPLEYGKIKYSAFEPFDSCSINRVSGFSSNLIWTIGKSVAKLLNRTLHGRVDLKCQQIFEESWHVVPSFFPNYLISHADIKKNEHLEESKNKEIALSIALKAGKLIPPD